MPFYKFAPGLEPDTFIFPTDTGWLYSVAFINNSYVFKGNVLLENNNLSFEIIFGRSKLDKAAKGRDDFVSETIITIICKQFDALGYVRIYFFMCDMTDKRAAARSVSFNRWYESSSFPDWN